MIAFRCHQLPPSKDADPTRKLIVGMGPYSVPSRFSEYSYSESRRVSAIDEELRNGTLTQADTASIVIGSKIINYAYIVYNCTQFNPNTPVDINPNILNMSHAFEGCSNFNQPITLQPTENKTNFPINVDCMLRGASKFNHPITFHSLCHTFNNLFENCFNMNSDIAIKNFYIDNMSQSSANYYINSNFSFFLSNCYNFNANVNIGSNRNSYSYAGMFLNCYKYNRPFNIELSSDNSMNFIYPTTSAMFRNCYELNRPITITAHNVNGKLYVSHMFDGCSRFNQSIAFPRVEGVDNLFRNCVSFNANVTFLDPNNSGDYSNHFCCIDFNYFLAGCESYNRPFPFIFPEDAQPRSYMHMMENCYIFNHPITLPRCENRRPSTAYMLANCYRFNSPLILGANLWNCSHMLYRANRFNQDIYIPSCVGSIDYALANCTNFGKNIYITATTDPWITDITGLLANTSPSTSKHIHFSPTFDSIFRYSNAMSVIGAPITWTNTTNGFYNSYYNIHCHNNYYL